MPRVAPVAVGIDVVVAAARDLADSGERPLRMGHRRAHHLLGEFPVVESGYGRSGEPVPHVAVFDLRLGEGDAAQDELVVEVAGLGTEDADADHDLLADVLAQVEYRIDIGLGIDRPHVVHRFTDGLRRREVHDLYPIIYGLFGCSSVGTDLERHRAVVLGDEFAAEDPRVEVLEVGRVALVVRRVVDLERRSLVLLLPLSAEVERTHVVAGPVPVGVHLGVAPSAVFVVVPLVSRTEVVGRQVADQRLAADFDVYGRHLVHEVRGCDLHRLCGVSLLGEGHRIVRKGEVLEEERTVVSGSCRLLVAQRDRYSGKRGSGIPAVGHRSPDRGVGVFHLGIEVCGDAVGKACFRDGDAHALVTLLHEGHDVRAAGRSLFEGVGSVIGGLCGEFGLLHADGHSGKRLAEVVGDRSGEGSGLARVARSVGVVVTAGHSPGSQASQRGCAYEIP